MEITFTLEIYIHKYNSPPVLWHGFYLIYDPPPDLFSFLSQTFTTTCLFRTRHISCNSKGIIVDVTFIVVNSSNGGTFDRERHFVGVIIYFKRVLACGHFLFFAIRRRFKQSISFYFFFF